MPNKRPSLADIRARVRNRADMPGQFVTNANLDEFINDELEELYELLVQRHADYFERKHAFTAVADQEDYPLPDDFYKLLAVDIKSSSSPSDWVNVRRFGNEVRNRLNNSTQLSSRSSAIRYALRGNQIRLAPAPTSGLNARIVYVPQVERLKRANQRIPLQIVAGWVNYIVVGATIKCKQKEDMDASVFIAEKSRLETRIKRSASIRDTNEPLTVTNVRRGVYSDDFGDDEEYYYG